MLDTRIACLLCSATSCIRSYLVRWRLESLQIPCLHPATDTLPTVAHGFRGERDRGIGLRSLYEDWKARRRGDVVRVNKHMFTIAITNHGIAIRALEEDYTWSYLCMLIYSSQSRDRVWCRVIVTHNDCYLEFVDHTTEYSDR